jgi:hypothetical protein
MYTVYVIVLKMGMNNKYKIRWLNSNQNNKFEIEQNK